MCPFLLKYVQTLIMHVHLQSSGGIIIFGVPGVVMGIMSFTNKIVGSGS